MACSDDEWVQDIISAIADIRADATGLELAAFAANGRCPPVSDRATAKPDGRRGPSRQRLRRGLA
jgi:hypothetical protein